jgi:hypothetical protein
MSKGRASKSLLAYAVVCAEQLLTAGTDQADFRVRFTVVATDFAAHTDLGTTGFGVETKSGAGGLRVGGGGLR